MKKRVARKWILGLIGGSMLILLAIQAVFFFFGDEILKESILLAFNRYSQKNYAVDKRPVLDFENLSINIFTGNLSLTGLYYSGYLSTDSSDASHTDHLKLMVHEAEIEGIKFLELYKKKALNLEKIYFFNPDIQWLRSHEKDTLQSSENIQQLAEKLQIHLTEYISEFSFQSLHIVQGNLFVTVDNYSDSLQNVKSTFNNKFHAQQLDIDLYDFLLDSLSHKREDRFFFTKDINVKLANYQLLTDSVYLLKADTLGFSSRKEHIYLKSLSMLPLSKSLKNKVNLLVPEVKLTQISWQEFFFDSLVQANQLIVEQPKVLLEVKDDSVSAKSFSHLNLLRSDSLYQLISDRIRNLSISDMLIRGGGLEINKLGADSLKILDASGIDILVSNITLDSSRLAESTLALPLDSIDVLVNQLKLFLPDKKHFFASSNAHLLTHRKDEFTFDVKFDSVLFKTEADSLKELLMNPLQNTIAFDIRIPKISLFGIHLGTFLEDHAALLDSVCISRPDVQIANFSKQSLGKLASGIDPLSELEQESVKSLLYDWSNARLNLNPIIVPGDSSALFQSLRAGQLKIDSGSVSILKAKDDLSGYSQITAVDTFYTFLENISIDGLLGDTTKFADGKVAVLADEVDLQLLGSKFLLPGERGEGGLLEVEESSISTFRNIANFRNIYFWTNHKRPPSTEVWLHKMYIPYIAFDRVNLDNIYINQNADIAKLSIFSPQITLNYKKNNFPRKEFKFDFKNLYPQLSTYLNQLSVPEIRVQNAALVLQKVSRQGVEPLFVTDQLDVSLKGFFLDSLSRMSRLRPFYADVLDVKAANYQWNFYPEDDSYPLSGVKGNSIHYNSYEGQLDASNITVLTNTSGRDHLQNLQLFCEKIRADDINPYLLIHDKFLQVGRVSIQKPTYLKEERDKEEKEEEEEKVMSRQILQPDLNTLLNKNLQKIHLRFVNVERGTLRYKQMLTGDTLSYVKVDSIDFRAKNLIVNGQESRHLHKILYADDIDFSFFADKILSDKRAEAQQRVLIEDAVFSSRDAHLLVDKLHFIPPPNVFQYQKSSHFELNAERLNVNGLDFKSAYLYGDFHVQKINIGQSDLKIYLGEDKAEKKKTDDHSIHELISPYLEEISVGLLQYPQSALAVYEKRNQKLKFSTTKLQADISNFHVDQSSFSLSLGGGQNASAEMFFSKDININIQDYSKTIADGMYVISAEEVNLEAGKNRIEINGAKLKPQWSRAQMLEKFTYSQSVADIDIDRIEMREVDFEALMEEEKLIVGQFLVYEPTIQVFKDKRLPRDSSKRPAINLELLYGIDHYIKIDELLLSDGMLSYAERAEGADEDGIIRFEALNLTAKNLRNDPQAKAEKLETSLEVSSKLMGEGEFLASFRFPQASERQSFSVNGSLSKMDLTVFNQILEPIAHVHIKEGINQDLKFEFQGDAEKTHGKMEFRYNDLSIQMLDKEKGKSGLDEKLGSFLANAFVLKANNPNAVFLRIGNIDYERDKSRAMFHYWLKSFLSGVKSSIGLDKNIEKTKDFADLKED